MTILQTIKERRSIHSFKKENVPPHILKEIFTYGTWAPTHYMKEPWNVIVYENEGKQRIIQATIDSYVRLGVLKKDGTEKAQKTINSISQFLFDIPHHALIYFPIEEDPVRYEEEYAAVCAFIQNVQLAAWEYGVGVLWTITPSMHEESFAKDLGLSPEEVKIAAVLQMGYPEKVPVSKGRTNIEQKLQFCRTRE